MPQRIRRKRPTQLRNSFSCPKTKEGDAPSSLFSYPLIAILYPPQGQETTGSPASVSMASNRLYFASRSECVTEPTSIWSPLQPKERWASQSSSVFPLRALTITCHPAARGFLGLLKGRKKDSDEQRDQLFHGRLLL